MRVEKLGAAQIVELDRPKALNAFNEDMCKALSAILPKLVHDPETYILILASTSQRAFCAGGDIRQWSAWVTGGEIDTAANALAREYALIWALDCFAKPSVSLAQGIVMGSGAGLSAFNTHRVGAENYTWAMPETLIGFFPDVGIAHQLARMPDEIGMFLGLTGHRLDRDEAFALGLLTHLINEEHFASIRTRLADAWPVDDVLDELGLEQGSAALLDRSEMIRQCFSGQSVEEIVRRLEDVTGADEAFARETIDTLAARSPIALKVSFEHIRRAATLDLRETLINDTMLGAYFMREPDFVEGVRAALIDKDKSPRWRHPGLSAVSDEEVARFFEPPDGGLADLPSRESLQRLPK